MPASANYLTKYLSASTSKSNHNINGDFADSDRPKKKRKKDKSATASLIIADDDEDLSLRRSAGIDDDDDGPLVYDSGKPKVAEFRKKKDSAWKSLRNGHTSPSSTAADGQDNLHTTVTTTSQRPRRRSSAAADLKSDGQLPGDGGDDADRLLAEATEEQDARFRAEQRDEAPTVADDDGPVAHKLSNGARAGLQTAADTAALLAAEREREQEEERRANRERKKNKKSSRQDTDEIGAQGAQETIYRDATGRRIDVSLARAEARRAEQEKRQADKKEKENAMGAVQLRQKEERKQELEDAKFLTLGRGVDDVEMNRQLKEVVRWDDPMAAYMADRAREVRVEDGAAGDEDDKGGGAVRLHGSGRDKMYRGAAPPNRYGIKPGFRWDGVDRGNGFEKEWFQTRSRKENTERMEYQWQMDE